MQKQTEKKQKKPFFAKKEKPVVEYAVDKPRPLSVLKDEKAKTQAVIENTAVEKAVADDQVQKLERQYKPRLEEFQTELSDEKKAQLKLPQEAVDKFQNDVAATTERIKVLKKQLQNEECHLGQLSDSLSQSENDLSKATKVIDRSQKKAIKTKKATLNGELGKAKNAQTIIAKKHEKIIRAERHKTVKSFLSESFKRAVSDVAAFPDIAVKAVRAQWAALKEVCHVFNKSAKKAQDAYAEPTWFSKTRRKPVVKTEKPVVSNQNKADKLK